MNDILNVKRPSEQEDEDFIRFRFSSDEVICIYTKKNRGNWQYRTDRNDDFLNYHYIAEKLKIDCRKIVRPSQNGGGHAAAVISDSMCSGVFCEPVLKDTDGLVTDKKDLALCMFQSDCIPVYLFDLRKKVIGLAHCGRSGTEANVVGNTIRLMRQSYGCRPDDIEAVIGPHICKNCYYVDEQTSRHFSETFPKEERNSFVHRVGEKWYIDLGGAVLFRMKEAGIPQKNIRISDKCTMEDKQLYSYRGGDDYSAGLSLIVIRSGERKNVNDNDYRTWVQYDIRYNQKEAWDAAAFPNAAYRYLKDNGCFVVSLAIMLRHFGVEKETDFSKFNPWIFYERAKAAKCIDSCADFDPYCINRLYPIEYTGDIPYSKENLSRYLDNGQPCLLEVSGRNGPYHYVVPYEILENDVAIIDCGFSYKYLSQFKKTFSIVTFRRM